MNDSTVIELRNDNDVEEKAENAARKRETLEECAITVSVKEWIKDGPRVVVGGEMCNADDDGRFDGDCRGGTTRKKSTSGWRSDFHRRVGARAAGVQCGAQVALEGGRGRFPSRSCLRPFHYRGSNGTRTSVALRPEETEMRPISWWSPLVSRHSGRVLSGSLHLRPRSWVMSHSDHLLQYNGFPFLADSAPVF